MKMLFVSRDGISYAKYRPVPALWNNVNEFVIKTVKQDRVFATDGEICHAHVLDENGESASKKYVIYTGNDFGKWSRLHPEKCEDLRRAYNERGETFIP